MNSYNKKFKMIDECSGKKRIIFITFFVIVLLSLITYFLSIHKSTPTKAVSLTKVCYGSVPVIAEAPVHIALDQGFFLDEGLNLEMEIYSDWESSLNHLFEGDVHIIAATGIPIIYKSMDRDDFYIIAKFKLENFFYGVGRKDRAVFLTSDLTGKKVAVTHGTTGHYYFDKLLLLSGINSSDISRINLNAPDSLKALSEGSIDAIISWFPFNKRAEKALEDNATILKNDIFDKISWFFVVKKEFAISNPNVLIGFIRAVLKAHNYIKENPVNSVNIHSKINSIEKIILEESIGQLDYSLTLGQELLLELEEQARWVINLEYSDQTNVPNYLDFIYTNALKMIDPGAVTIIGSKIE